MSKESNIFNLKSAEESPPLSENDVQSSSETESESEFTEMILPSTSKPISMRGSLVEQVEKEFYGRSIIGLAQIVEQELFASDDTEEEKKVKDLESISLAAQADHDLNRKQNDNDENENEWKKWQKLWNESSIHDLGISNENLASSSDDIDTRFPTKICLDQLHQQTNRALICFKSTCGLSVFVEADHAGDLPKTSIIWIGEGINYEQKRLSIVPGTTVPSLKVLAAINAPLKN